MSTQARPPLDLARREALTDAIRLRLIALGFVAKQGKEQKHA